MCALWRILIKSFSLSPSLPSPLSTVCSPSPVSPHLSQTRALDSCDFCLCFQASFANTVCISFIFCTQTKRNTVKLYKYKVPFVHQYNGNCYWTTSSLFVLFFFCVQIHFSRTWKSKSIDTHSLRPCVSQASHVLHHKRKCKCIDVLVKRIDFYRQHATNALHCTHIHIHWSLSLILQIVWMIQPRSFSFWRIAVTQWWTTSSHMS